MSADASGMTDTVTITKGSRFWPADRERPYGLRDEDVCAARGLGEWYNHSRQSKLWGWSVISAIRLPITHPLAIAQRYADEHPGEVPFDRPWHGGDGAPADYNGREYLARNGVMYSRALTEDWPDLGDLGVVAYRAKQPEPAALPTYDPTREAVVPIISEAEAWEGYQTSPAVGYTNRHIQVLRDLGIIRRAPTFAEAFAAKHGVPIAEVEALIAEVRS